MQRVFPIHLLDLLLTAAKGIRRVLGHSLSFRGKVTTFVFETVGVTWRDVGGARAYTKRWGLRSATVRALSALWHSRPSQNGQTV